MGEPLLLGAIEAGGTKFLCAIIDRDGTTLMQTRIPTMTAEETLGAASVCFADATEQHGTLAAFSIGSFGPLSLNSVAIDYGWISSNPKTGWQNVDLLAHCRRTIAAPAVGSSASLTGALAPASRMATRQWPTH